eukprot:10932772-Alexandrium_andersonii.AAC.1
MADECIAAAAGQYIDNHAAAGGTTLQPIRFTSLYAVEINKACQEELLSRPHGPLHIFDDLLQCVPDHLRQHVGLDGGTALSGDELRPLLC